MADIDIDVNPQQSPIEISPNPQQNTIPVEVGEGTAPTYWGQILGNIDNQTDLKGKLDSKQDTIVDLDKYLKNNTTQDNGLAVLGTVSGPAGTAVGDNASATRAGVAIGRKAETLNYGVAIGGTDGNTITHASAASVAIGYGAVCSGSSAAQIGMGENTTGGTFQFKDYRLLNADGTIPNERIPQLSSKANTDLDNLTATGEAKFDGKADLDLSNVTVPLVKLSDLEAVYTQINDLKNKVNNMLGRIDWKNMQTVTLTVNSSTPTSSYTFSKGYFRFFSASVGSASVTFNNKTIRVTNIPSIPTTSSNSGVIPLENEIVPLSLLSSVEENDVLTLSGGSAFTTASVTFIFYPEKED